MEIAKSYPHNIFRLRRKLRVALLFLVTFHAATVVALVPLKPYSLLQAAGTNIAASAEPTDETEQRPPCYYKNASTQGWWTPRIDFDGLQVGQELKGIVIQDLLKGTKTGAKLWLDCGVGVCRKNKWKIVNGMLRLGYVKDSLARKRNTKLRKKGVVPVFVSRIRAEQHQFEVVLTREQLEKQKQVPLQSASSLSVGDEVTGIVLRLESYGAIVKLDGYNRNGLLHIQRVADLYEQYIDKEEGLQGVGLEKGATIKLQVESNNLKRLSLDFTTDVKESVHAERKRQDMAGAEAQAPNNNVASISTSDLAELEALYSDTMQSEEEPEEGSYDDYDEEQGNYDDYDEERDIEDSLGLGSY